MHSYKLVAILLTICYLSSQQLHVNAALKCYTCNSTDAKCISEPTAVASQDCADGSKCFTNRDNDGNVVRGCTKNADKSTVTCESPSCLSCDSGDNCNKHTICKSCESAKDPNCVETNATAIAFNSVCPLDSPNCIVQLANDKSLSRGCASDASKTSCESNAATCKACTGGNCNIGIFPENRLQCYKCNSATCDNVNEMITQPCLLYAADDKCYTYGDSATQMQRGCQTDATGKCPSSGNSTQCVTCTENGCNNLKFSRTAKLTCLQCDSKTTPSCTQAQNSTEAKSCKDIRYDQTEACYIQIKDYVIYRGCINDRAEALGACTKENGCTTCSDANGCNTADNSFTCIRCRSDLQSDCWDISDKMTGSACSKSDGQELGCFQGVWHDVAIRGCLIDADERMQYTCNNEKDNSCSVCKTKDCNNKKSSAPAALSGIGILGLLLISLWHFI